MKVEWRKGCLFVLREYPYKVLISQKSKSNYSVVNSETPQSSSKVHITNNKRNDVPSGMMHREDTRSPLWQFAKKSDHNQSWGNVRQLQIEGYSTKILYICQKCKDNEIQKNNWGSIPE